MHGRSLHPEENARVVAEVRKLLDAGETQSSLAPKLGVTQSTLSSLLQGRHHAGYNFARALARVLKKSVEEVLGGEYVSGSRWKPWRELPGFTETIAEARRLHPAVSEGAWRWIEALAAPPLPVHDARGFGEIAAAWEHVSDRGQIAHRTPQGPHKKSDMRIKVPPEK